MLYNENVSKTNENETRIAQRETVNMIKTIDEILECKNIEQLQSENYYFSIQMDYEVEGVAKVDLFSGETIYVEYEENGSISSFDVFE